MSEEESLVSGSALERLRDLQAAGVAFSRNKNFALFEQPGNREALSLHRYLDALAEEITQGHEQGSLAVTAHTPSVGPISLEIVRRDLGIKHTVHLHAEELEALGDRLEVRATLASYGIDVPMAGS